MITDWYHIIVNIRLRGVSLYYIRNSLEEEGEEERGRERGE